MLRLGLGRFKPAALASIHFTDDNPGTAARTNSLFSCYGGDRIRTSDVITVIYRPENGQRRGDELLCR